MTKFFIPNLLEYLYNCLDSRGKDYLFERLSREELKRINSKTKVKNYVEKSRFEEIAWTISKLNYGVGIVIWDKEKQTNNNIKDVLIAQLEVPENDLTKHIIKSKVHSILPIDIAKALMVTSKASQSLNWSVNSRYLAIAKHRYQGMTQRNLVSNLEAQENLKWYVDTISTSLKLSPLLEHYKILVLDFQILLFLHNSPNGATVEAVKQYVSKPRGFKGNLKRLNKLNMIEYSPDKTVIKIGINGYVTLDAIISKFP